MEKPKLSRKYKHGDVLVDLLSRDEFDDKIHYNDKWCFVKVLDINKITKMGLKIRYLDSVRLANKHAKQDYIIVTTPDQNGITWRLESEVILATKAAKALFYE